MNEQLANPMSFDPPPDKATPIKDMMYGGDESGTNSATYRLERGTPLKRRGTIVKALPQFRALSIYSGTSSNSFSTFGVNQQSTQIRYPGTT